MKAWKRSLVEEVICALWVIAAILSYSTFESKTPAYVLFSKAAIDLFCCFRNCGKEAASKKLKQGGAS